MQDAKAIFVPLHHDVTYLTMMSCVVGCCFKPCVWIMTNSILNVSVFSCDLLRLMGLTYWC